MNLRADEISSLIQKQIEGFEEGIELKETGRVISVGDGIARIYGLGNAMAGELLEFPGGLSGMVLNLEEDNVGAVLLGRDDNIKEGDEVIHRGISQRSFARSFTIADDVKVNGAELKDGLLTISCEKIIPEMKKKRLIEIK